MWIVAIVASLMPLLLVQLYKIIFGISEKNNSKYDRK